MDGLPESAETEAKTVSKSKWLGLPDGSVPSVIGRLYRANGSDGILECAKVGYFRRILSRSQGAKEFQVSKARPRAPDLF
jgi:hypothetical protein